MGCGSCFWKEGTLGEACSVYFQGLNILPSSIYCRKEQLEKRRVSETTTGEKKRNRWCRHNLRKVSRAYWGCKPTWCSVAAEYVSRFVSVSSDQVQHVSGAAVSICAPHRARTDERRAVSRSSTSQLHSAWLHMSIGASCGLHWSHKGVSFSFSRAPWPRLFVRRWVFKIRRFTKQTMWWEMARGLVRV